VLNVLGQIIAESGNQMECDDINSKDRKVFYFPPRHKNPAFSTVSERMQMGLLPQGDCNKGPLYLSEIQKSGETPVLAFLILGPIQKLRILSARVLQYLDFPVTFR
jgi:hypothetical protein